MMPQPVALQSIWGKKRRFDVVELKEDIAKGQRISGFKIEVEINGRWVTYGEGSTVGYRRLVQGKPVEAQKKFV